MHLSAAATWRRRGGAGRSGRGRAHLVSLDLCNLLVDLMLCGNAPAILGLAALGDGHGRRQPRAHRRPSTELRAGRERRGPRWEVHGARGSRWVSSIGAALVVRIGVGSRRVGLYSTVRWSRWLSMTSTAPSLDGGAEARLTFQGARLRRVLDAPLSWRVWGCPGRQWAAHSSRAQGLRGPL